MYRVIKAFYDTLDDDHYYEAGDPYPREGLQVAEKRIAELAGIKNRRRTALIAPAQEEEAPEQQEEAAEEAAETTEPEELPEEAPEEAPEESAEKKPKNKKKKGKSDE